MFRKDSFGSYNKRAPNGNDSQTVLGSQRIPHQNIEGAAFCGGNSAAPCVLAEPGFSLRASHSPWQPRVSFLSLWGSLHPGWLLLLSLPTRIRAAPQCGDPKQTITKSNKQTLRYRKPFSPVGLYLLLGAPRLRRQVGCECTFWALGAPPVGCKPVGRGHGERSGLRWGIKSLGCMWHLREWKHRGRFRGSSFRFQIWG